MKPGAEFERRREWQMTTRRHFLSRSGAAVLGTVGLASLLNERLFAATNADSGFTPVAPHYAPRARNVIYLSMAGAPSQLDLLDYKPELVRLDGERLPDGEQQGLKFTSMTNRALMRLLSPRWEFSRCGQEGLHVSNLLPHLREVINDISVIRSMHSSEINHGPAQLLIHSGSARLGRPSIGSWVVYGLGSENHDLPGYIVLNSGKGTSCGMACHGNGFLPGRYQGVPFRSAGDPVLYLGDPEGVSRAQRRESLDTLNELNTAAFERYGDPEIQTRIDSFEMAFRMQSSVPDLMDISQESAAVQEMYGTQPGRISFANNCLLARRLVERGVRFVELVHGGWDHHGAPEEQNLISGLPERCREIDRASAALIKDLKQRGLLEDTLVIWGGEFGRLPLSQVVVTESKAGRDHSRSAFTIWMAGGGVKSGFVLGETDTFGLRAAVDPVHVHDLQATILHCLGLDHTRLTYRYQGRDQRLTDVSGQVVHKLLV